MPNIRKYGVAFKTSGVYMLTCTINGKRYIGSSNCIGSRLSSHFGYQMRKGFGKPLYDDMRKYGKDNFEYEVLEVTNPDENIYKEQLWVEKLKPEYNLVFPESREFISEERKNKVKYSDKQMALYDRNKELFNTGEYKDMFREYTRQRMKPVILIDKSTGEELRRFESLSETARWLDENTTFKHVSKASEVKAVCDGNRKSAYGYTYRYENPKDKYIHKSFL